MSLRLRVAATTTLVTLIVVALAGLALVALVAREERDQLDDDLRAGARLAATRAVSDIRAGRLDTEGPPEERRAPVGIVGRVIVDGRVAIVYGDYPLATEEAATEEGLPDGLSTRRVDDERWRFVSEPASVALPNLPSVLRGRVRTADIRVEVAEPMAPVNATVGSVARQVLRLGVLAVVVAGVLGWLLGGAALRPLARLRRDAERVSGTHDLEVRVADQQGLREVDELGRSLNLMLDRIRQATDETAVALEASRSFAANAAHELRTPLTSIQANIDVLERNPELSATDRATILGDIQSQQQRLVRLLSALRLLARGDLERIPLEGPVDLADLVEGSVERARRHHTDARFGLSVERGPWTVPGWEEGLQVLVDNLLDNAALHGHRDEAGADVTVIVRGTPTSVELIVEDRGPGIAPSERRLVLERFARAAGTTGPGSGLGLALVHQQVLLHGGTLEVGENPVGGARLVVGLPATDPQPAS